MFKILIIILSISNGLLASEQDKKIKHIIVNEKQKSEKEIKLIIIYKSCCNFNIFNCVQNYSIYEGLKITAPQVCSITNIRKKLYNLFYKEGNIPCCAILPESGDCSYGEIFTGKIRLNFHDKDLLEYMEFSNNNLPNELYVFFD